MMWTLALVVGLAGQTTSEAKAVAKMDGVKIRQIYEAALSAKAWAKAETKVRFPSKTIIKLSIERRKFLAREEEECEKYLASMALARVGETYKVKTSILKYITDHPEIALKHDHVKDGMNRWFIGDVPDWARNQTRFTPKYLVLDNKLSRRFRYRKTPEDSQAQVKPAPPREPTLKEQLLKESKTQDRPRDQPPDRQDRPGFPALPTRLGSSGR
jgi:hypothetical protein